MRVCFLTGITLVQTPIKLFRVSNTQISKSQWEFSIAMKIPFPNTHPNCTPLSWLNENVTIRDTLSADIMMIMSNLGGEGNENKTGVYKMLKLLFIITTDARVDCLVEWMKMSWPLLYLQTQGSHAFSTSHKIKINGTSNLQRSRASLLDDLFWRYLHLVVISGPLGTTWLGYGPRRTSKV